MRPFLTTLFCSLFYLVFCQDDTVRLTNSYQSESNPHYWKNKLPYPGYWQQDVAYHIEASINDSLNTIEGNKYRLDYTNNSNDTLSTLYFHLFQNAFQPHSHMHNLYENNGKEVSFGNYEKEGLGTKVENVVVGETHHEVKIVNTLLKIELKKPLLPHSSVSISMNFTTFFDNEGSLRRRLKHYESSKNNKHYNGVHWYPSICVYDRKFGWTTEQHLDKEFYHNFGLFDVRLTFPGDYIVGATGTLQNEEEVFKNGLREKIDLKNFTNTKDTSQLFDLKLRKQEQVTWHFYAENVHNFVFTADPMYRIGEVFWNNIKVQTLVQQKNAKNWENSGYFTADVIKTYSEDFGHYAWPKIIIADADDGMEYSMVTLDRGSFPQHKSLLAHEVGHMWFYGMVGTNETYRAFLDEGFTQFLTVWALEAIDGKETNYKDFKGKGRKNYLFENLYPKKVRYESLYYPYIKTVRDGYDHQLNTHSSMFRGATRHAGGYGLAYYKTGVMLYNLQYVLGDELFLEAMKFYFSKWKFAHPYPEDFRQTITDFTKVDLNWFFDQWLETTKNIDYGVKKVTQSHDSVSIVLRRKGEMQMPLDLTATTASGKKLHFHIPNTFFNKQTTAHQLPLWYGWQNLNPLYEFKFVEKEEIVKVEIDPSHRLADINANDNQWNKKNQTPHFENFVKNYAWWYEKENFWRPDVWYDELDGVQIGAKFKGNYFQKTWSYEANFLLNSRPLYDKNTKGQPFEVSIDLKQQLYKLGKRIYMTEGFYWGTGVYKGQWEFEKVFKNQDSRQTNYSKFNVNFSLLYRFTSDQYVFNPSLWSYQLFNNTITTSYTRKYRNNKNSGTITAGLTTPNFGSDFNYSHLHLSATNEFKKGKFLFKYRAFGRYGLGNIAPESALYAASASQEELLNHRLTKAPGLFPASSGEYGSSTNLMHVGGGLNLRGFSGYTLPTSNGNAFFGKSGLAMNVEVEFQNLFDLNPLKRRTNELKLYTFFDGGIIEFESNNINHLSSFLCDAGVGTSLTLKSKYYTFDPLTLRLDLPFYVNTQTPGSNRFDWRFIFGINRAF